MKRVVAIEPYGGEAADTVTLDHDRRTRRRIALTTDGGHAILLDRPRAGHLRAGEVLRLEDGAGVRVIAADETVTEISAPDTAALVRIAWHLGNRHLPTQLLADANGGKLRIRHDHVIEAMAEGLGGTCATVQAPFDPEGGAYEGAPTAHHHHHHHHAEHDAPEHDHGHHHHG